MKPTRLVLLTVLAVIAWAPAPAMSGDHLAEIDLAPRPFVQKIDTHLAFVQALDLEPLEPIQAGALTVVPLRTRTPLAPLAIKGHPTLIEATVSGASRTRPMLRLRNPTDAAILITAGRVAYKGDAEVVLAHDVVVPAKGASLARALPGSYPSGTLARGDGLTWYPRWAPPSLRESIVTDATKYDIKTFRTLFQDVVGEAADARVPSLRDVLSSRFARGIDAKVAQVMHDARFRGEGVVGFVSGLHGRPYTMQVFGSPQLHRKNAGALLESHGIYAAALALRAEELGIKLRSGKSASNAIYQAARSLTATLRSKSRVEDTAGAVTPVHGPGLVGRATWHAGKPVHLAIYPHDPYREALFSRVFQWPAEQLVD